jgi:hypothetical protein
MQGFFSVPSFFLRGWMVPETDSPDCRFEVVTLVSQFPLCHLCKKMLPWSFGLGWNAQCWMCIWWWISLGARGVLPRGYIVCQGLCYTWTVLITGVVNGDWRSTKVKYPAIRTLSYATTNQCYTRGEDWRLRGGSEEICLDVSLKCSQKSCDIKSKVLQCYYSSLYINSTVTCNLCD